MDLYVYSSFTATKRELSGLGTYVLRAGFPVCDSMPHQLAFAQQPADIVPTLQEPSAKVSHKHSLRFE